MVHINRTYSIEDDVVKMLEQYARMNGRGFKVSRYVSNRLKEALIRDLGATRRVDG